jgi:hypothetical protein
MSTEKNTQTAAKLVAKVKDGIAAGKYTHRNTTWTYGVTPRRLDKHDDATGNWHTVGHYSRTEAIRLIAEEIASRIPAEGEDDSLRFYVGAQMEREGREKEARA